MSYRFVTLQAMVGFASVASMTAALVGCSNADTGDEEMTDVAVQALSQVPMLSNEDATEAVRAECVGSYVNQGQCSGCVAKALGVLLGKGEITPAQRNALFTEISDGECADACIPTSCTLEGANCGGIFDGCNGTLSCGWCSGYESCGGGGTPAVCGCTPLECADVGANCGTIDDNCGGTVFCGSCTGEEICGGGGTSHVCGLPTPELCDGIDRDGDGIWNTDVPSVCPTIQSALDVATPSSTIRVAPGIYHENLHFKGARTTLISTGGAAVTIVDGNQNGPVVTFDYGESSASVLDGFTLQNGSGKAGEFGSAGGGLHITWSSPTLRNLVVTGNSVKGSYHNGAGAYIRGGNVTITNSTFVGNEASYYGGGMLVYSGTVSLDQVIITGNSATYGGGIGSYYGRVYAKNSVFSGNSAHQGSSVFLQYGGDGKFSNVTFMGNKGDVGGISTWGVQVDLVNVIFANGVSTSFGSAVYVEPSYPAVVNFDHCDFWNNNNAEVYGLPSPLGQNGNIAANPEFIDVTSSQSVNWDLHLAPSSPLRNAGTNALTNPDGSVSDIGAYGGPGGGW